MYTSKTKTYNNFSISELKEDLRIHSTDSTYDSELMRILKASISIAEKTISGDIVPTTNTLTDYCIYGCYYQINEPNITISSITQTNQAGVQSSVTGYTVYKFSSYTLLKFTSLNAETLNIVYTSGYSVLPDDLKRAIVIKAGELFDIEKNGYVQSNMKESKAFMRIISPYTNMVY